MSLPNPFLELDRKMVGDIYTSPELMDNLLMLCDDFGSRFGGTKGERQAAEFFKAKMESYGLSNVRLEPVDYIGWRRGAARFEILEPLYKELPCISLPHSPAGVVEAQLVDMGDGDPFDFERRSEEIPGRILMNTSAVNTGQAKRWVHRSEKYGRAVLGGAAGFIFVNHYPGFGPATGGVGNNGSPGWIPAISLAREDGDFLRRLMQRKGTLRVRLTTTDANEPMVSWNVVGELPGSLKPAPVVMLGCHYDGHDISQGAGDPASGAVALLEAARVLAQHAVLDGKNLPCTIRFALWGIEEIGLLGSRAYVQQHKTELSSMRFYLNMDAAGTAMHTRDILLNEWQLLEPLFRRYKEEMAADFQIGQSLHTHSDHFPFFMEGVPTGGIEPLRRSMEGRGYGHTRHDTVDKINQADLREAAALAARIALRVATEQNWTAVQRSPEDVLALLDSPDFRTERIFRNQLDEFYRTQSR